MSSSNNNNHVSGFRRPTSAAGPAVPMSLAQSVYAECCRKRNVKVNVQILDQLKTVAAPHITSIDATCTFLGAQGVHALLDFVEVHRGIECLNLCKNGVDTDCIHHICQLLDSHHPSLASILLDHNPISVPTARAMWECAKRNNQFQEVSLVGCRVPDEWERRIERCLEGNRNHQTLGFVNAFIRRPEQWATVFVALIAPASLTQTIIEQVIQVSSSLSAAAQVRIGTIVLKDDDSEETVIWKLNLCRDDRNYGLPRLMVVIDHTNYNNPVLQYAVRHCNTFTVPEVAALKNKLGQQRDPVLRPMTNLFIYCDDFVTSVASEWDAQRFEQRSLTAEEEDISKRYENFKKQLILECTATRPQSHHGPSKDLSSGDNEHHALSRPCSAAAASGSVECADDPLHTMQRRLLSVFTFTIGSLDSLILRAQTDLLVSFTSTLSCVAAGTPEAQQLLQRNAGSPASDLSPISTSAQRSPTSLSGALATAYLQPSFTGESDSAHARTVEELQQWAALGEELSEDLADVLRYVSTPASTHSYPLVLYGGQGAGKRNIAAAAALRLMQAEYQATAGARLGRSPMSHAISGAASGSAAALAHKIVPIICADSALASPVVLCYALLSIFAPEKRDVFYATLEDLAFAVRSSMELYRGACRVTVFLIGLDKVDACCKRDFSVLSCIASCLPVNVRVIITVATESPLLVGFRSMLPQPYEQLVRRGNPTTLLKMVSRVAGGAGNMVIPGLEPSLISDATSVGLAQSSPLPSAVKSICLKEDFDTHMYCELVGLLLRYNAASLTSLHDVVTFLDSDESVPGTLVGALRRLLRTYETLLKFDASSLRAILLTVVASPLAMTELVVACEVVAASVATIEGTAGLRTQYTVLPIVLQLLQDGLLGMHSDAIVHVSCSALAAVVRDMYGKEQSDMYATLVASHLHRLVVTQSPEMSFAFQRCVPLLLENTQLELVEKLVLDPISMDMLLAADSFNRIVAIDAVYRLLHVSQLLREILAVHTLQFVRNDTRRSYRLALHQLQQRCCALTPTRSSTSSSSSSPPAGAPNPNSYFFQSCLLAHRDCPYRMAALASLDRVPYPVLVPKNDVGEETLSSFSVALTSTGAALHCHTIDDLIVATTSSLVSVYRLHTPQSGAAAGESGTVIPVAQLRDPFGPSVALLGALAISDTKVVIVASNQLLLWDLSPQASASWVLIPDATTSLSGNSIDITRTNVLCVAPSTMQLVVLDINKRKVTPTQHPLDGIVIREAVFAGMHNTIVVVSVYDVTLFFEDGYGQPNGKVVLTHHGVVRSIAASPDGKFIITAVDRDVFLWTSRGELLHMCSKHTAAVNDVAFHPNGSMFVSCSDDGTVKVWKTLTGLVAQVLPVDIPVTSDKDTPVVPHYIAFSSDGTRIFARCDDYVRQWDAITFLSAGAVRAAGGCINYMSVTNNGLAVAAVTSSGELRVWTTKNGFPTPGQAAQTSVTTCLLQEARVTNNPPMRTLKVAPGGNFIMARDAANEVSVWNARNGKLKSAKLSNIDAFCALDGDTLFTVEPSPPRIVVFSFATNEVIGGTLLPRDMPVDPLSIDISFTHNKEQLLVVVNAGTATRIVVLDLPSFKVSNVFIGHYANVVFCERIDADLLMSAAEDGTVRLWSLSGHAERASYKHHRRIVSALQSQGSNTVKQPILFIDGEGEVYDALLSNAALPDLAHIDVRKKAIQGTSGSGSRSGSRVHSVRIASTTLHLGRSGSLSTSNSPSVAAAIGSSNGAGAKLTFASRVNSELLLVVDDSGAVFIIDQVSGGLLNAIPSMRCSCTPVVLSSPASMTQVVLGTKDGDIRLFDMVLPPLPESATGTRSSSIVPARESTPQKTSS